MVDSSNSNPPRYELNRLDKRLESLTRQYLILLDMVARSKSRSERDILEERAREILTVRNSLNIERLFILERVISVEDALEFNRSLLPTIWDLLLTPTEE